MTMTMATMLMMMMMDGDDNDDDDDDDDDVDDEDHVVYDNYFDGDHQEYLGNLNYHLNLSKLLPIICKP